MQVKYCRPVTLASVSLTYINPIAAVGFCFIKRFVSAGIKMLEVSVALAGSGYPKADGNRSGDS